MSEDALDKLRRVVDTRAAPLRPHDRYGEPIPGLTWLPLDFDEAVGAGLYLVRFAPGAKSLPHEHSFGEAFIVLEGRLVDSDGRELKTGEFVHYAPGSQHWSAAPEGCLLAVYLRGPNKRI
jgi:quercetin dioxygenase-like cupin family protein